MGAMKNETSLVAKVSDNSAKGVGIYRVSAIGQKLGQNLDGPSFCRFCEGVTMSYSNAYTHSSKLLCNLLTAPYSITCPICKTYTTTRPVDFFNHIRENHDDITQQITHLERPVGMSSNNFRQWTREKAFAMVWMVELVKKIVEVHGINSKPFLPALTTTVIASRKAFVMEKCLWPICLRLNGIGWMKHTHDSTSTDNFGRCNYCKNWHRAPLKMGELDKACAKDGFKGVLPTAHEYGKTEQCGDCLVWQNRLGRHKETCKVVNDMKNLKPFN